MDPQVAVGIIGAVVTVVTVVFYPEWVKQRAAAKVVANYREPLLAAAVDLQSRLFNIVQGGFLWAYYANEPDYAESSTLYVVAEYLGWVETIRRDVQHLDLGSVKQTRDLNHRLEAVAALFGTDSLCPPFCLFRTEQRAIGEIMLIPRPAPDVVRYDCCLGYVAFAQQRKDAEFEKWFARLRTGIAELASVSPVSEKAEL